MILPLRPRTSSILACLLSLIAMVSFQQNCLSQIAQDEITKKRQDKTILEAGDETLNIEGQISRLDPSSIFSKLISRNTAGIAWHLALVLTGIFSIVKIIRIMSGNAPLWTLKIPLILINCIAVQVIWIFCLYINFSKTFYSSEGPVYAILWIFFLFVIFCGYNWIFNNLCAAGSRAFLGQGIIITGVGLLSVSIAIINKGKLVFPVALLVIGLFNLVPSFLKSAKEFRTSACLSKQNVPIQMIYSILLLIALITFYVVGDIIKNLEDNTKLSLFAITFFIPCISIAVLPLYFGWRWRDGFALRFYQLLLALIAAYYLIAPLSGVAEPVGIVESILALGIICIAFSLTFHAAVRKWAANLKPVF